MKIVSFNGKDSDLTQGTRLGTSDLRAKSLTGFIAYHVGGPATFEEFRVYDENLSDPGGRGFADIFGDRPVLILVDELVEWVSRAMGHGLPAANIKQTVSALAHAIVSSPRTVLVITTPEQSHDAFGADSIALLDIMGSVASTLTRQAHDMTPSGDDDLPAILRQRLFTHCDEAVRRETAYAYAQIARRANPADTEAEKRFFDSYPFHPDLMDIIQGWLFTNGDFQRARGAIRLMANIITGQPGHTRRAHPPVPCGYEGSADARSPHRRAESRPDSASHYRGHRGGAKHRPHYRGLTWHDTQPTSSSSAASRPRKRGASTTPRSFTRYSPPATATPRSSAPPCPNTPKRRSSSTKPPADAGIASRRRSMCAAWFPTARSASPIRTSSGTASATPSAIEYAPDGPTPSKNIIPVCMYPSRRNSSSPDERDKAYLSILVANNFNWRDRAGNEHIIAELYHEKPGPSGTLREHRNNVLYLVADDDNLDEIRENLLTNMAAEASKRNNKATSRNSRGKD